MSSFLLPLVKRLKILTKDAGIVPFQPNDEQLIFLDEYTEQLQSRRPVRMISLKARQIGISTITEAIIYCMSFVFPNLRSAVIADEVPNAHHLLSMTDLYWETDPFKRLYNTKYQAKNTLHWVETASSINTMTAGNKQAGRSRTIHQLHASEVAFWRDADNVMLGLLQAVPDTPRSFVAVESTANGIGNYFNREWNAAMSGDTAYAPMFFPWWAHKNYRAHKLGIPPYNLAPLDSEERALLSLFRTGLTVGHYSFNIPETEYDDALAWRRWQIANKCQGDINKFHQEYPSTPEEAFIATGTNVFPLPHLKECFKPVDGQRGRLFRQGSHVEFKPDVTGPLTVFKAPSDRQDWGTYVIGGDPTQTTRGDFACAQVINRRTLEQVAVFRHRQDPHHFANSLRDLGFYYHTALIASENEGPGYATIGALVQSDYPNLYQSVMPENLPGRVPNKFGWSSSYKTKESAIGALLKLIVDHQIVIHDRTTFHELQNYVILPGGEYGNADQNSGHDDTVMALAVAVASNFYSGPIEPVSAPGFTDSPAPWESWGSGLEQQQMSEVDELMGVGYG